MGALFDQLQGFFTGLGWQAARVPDHPVLSVTYQGENGQWVIVSTVDEDHRILVLFARAPFACPPERFAALREWIVRANFGMTHGNFDLDHGDGEIRYRLGVSLGGLQIDDVFFLAQLRYVIATMDVYLPSLREVVEGGEEPHASLQRLGLGH